MYTLWITIITINFLITVLLLLYPTFINLNEIFVTLTILAIALLIYIFFNFYTIFFIFIVYILLFVFLNRRINNFFIATIIFLLFFSLSTAAFMLSLDWFWMLDSPNYIYFFVIAHFVLTVVFCLTARILAQIFSWSHLLLRYKKKALCFCSSPIVNFFPIKYLSLLFCHP